MPSQNNLYRPSHYPGPIALDAKVSPEADAYLKKSCVQINVSPEFAEKYLKGDSDVKKDGDNRIDVVVGEPQLHSSRRTNSNS